MSTTYRKCQNCGTININRDYCKQCGEIINIVLKRQLKQEQIINEKKQEKASRKPNSITLFFENAKKHTNPLVRIPAMFFYSVWVVVIAIGSFLAFLFGYIAA